MPAEGDGAECYQLATQAVRDYLRAHPRTWVQREDLLADALFGVAQARAHYDPARGVPFGAYALRRARGAVLDGIRERSPLTRDEHRKGVTVDTCPPNRRHPLSLDEPLLRTTQTLRDLIPEQRQPFEAAVDTRDALRRCLDALPPRLAFVLRRVDLEGRTLLEVAGMLGVTESRACQLRREALVRARFYV